MRRALVCLWFALPLLALSNKVTIKEDSGSSHGTRQFVIPRYFAVDDVCGYPQPYIGGSPVTYWQSHVDNRWPASTICPTGSVKFSLIVIEIALAADASVDVEFRSSANACYLGSASTCAAAGMTKQQLLDFDAGSGTASWGAKLSISTGGLTQIASARSMISSSHYQLIHDGPIFSEVLVREGPEAVSGVSTRTTSLGFHCTGYGSAMAITDALNSATATLTVPSHGLIYGSIVEISGLTGTWAALNGIRKITSVASTNSFSINASSTTLGSYSGQNGSVRCSCPAPYSGMSWRDDEAYHSIRPSFWLRFYRRWQKVEVDFVAVNGWMDRFIDQRVESYTLYSGGAESTVALSQASPFLFPNRSMWWEPTFWNGSIPLASHIDFNTAYLTHSRVIPGLDPTKVPGSSTVIAQDYAVFLSHDQGLTTNGTDTPRMGQSMYPDHLGQAGSNFYSSLFSRYPIRYLTSFDPREYAIVIGNARAMMHLPLHYLEGSSSGSFLQGQSVNPFGRVLSLERRPYFTTNTNDPVRTDNPTTPAGDAILGCASLGCMIATPNSNFLAIQIPSTDYNRFTYDNAHLAEDYFVPFLVTGKRLFAEALYGQATGALSTGQATVVYQTTRLFSKGLIFAVSGASRSWAWPLKSLGRAAAVAPDGSPEQTYFTRILNNNVEMHEGRLAITDGAFPPSPVAAPYGCPTTQSSYVGKTADYASVWCFGRYLMSYGEANPLNYISEETVYDGGFNRYYTSMGVSAWMYAYPALVFGHLRDLGFTQVAKVQESTAKFFIGMLYDSGNGRNFYPHIYRIPALQYTTPGSAATHKFITDWTTAYNGVYRTSRLSRAMTATSTDIRVASLKMATPTFVPLMDWRASSFQLENETILTRGVSATSYTFSGPLAAATSRATFTAAHNFQSGDLVMITAAASGTPVDMPITADTDSCIYPGGKTFCYVYVKVIDTNTVEIYKDSNLTTLLPFSADVASLYAGTYQMSAEVSSSRCGGHCRGFNHTTAAAHAIGAELKWLGTYPAYYTIDDEDYGYAHYYRSVLAYGVTYPTKYNDTVTGRPVNANQAYQHVADYVTYQNKYADSPRWAFVPWYGPRHLRVNLSGSTANLFYVAPDGNSCSYALAGAPFVSSDSSADTSDGGGTLSRKVTLTGLTSGTRYLRVTCGPGGGAGRYYGTFVVP